MRGAFFVLFFIRILTNWSACKGEDRGVGHLYYQPLVMNSDSTKKVYFQFWSLFCFVKKEKVDIIQGVIYML